MHKYYLLKNLFFHGNYNLLINPNHPDLSKKTWILLKKYKSKSNLPIYWNHPMQSCWHYIQNQMNYAGLIQGEVNMDALFQQIK